MGGRCRLSHHGQGLVGSSFFPWHEGGVEEQTANTAPMFSCLKCSHSPGTKTILEFSTSPTCPPPCPPPDHHEMHPTTKCVCPRCGCSFAPGGYTNHLNLSHDPHCKSVCNSILQVKSNVSINCSGFSPTPEPSHMPPLLPLDLQPFPTTHTPTLRQRTSRWMMSVMSIRIFLRQGPILTRLHRAHLPTPAATVLTERTTLMNYLTSVWTINRPTRLLSIWTQTPIFLMMKVMTTRHTIGSQGHRPTWLLEMVVRTRASRLVGYFSL